MFLFQLVYILFLNDIQVRRLSIMTILRLRQLWPVNMKSCRPDALEGLKRRKDEGCIVSVKDDAFKRLLELPGKSMFKGLRLTPHFCHVIPAKGWRSAVVTAYHGPYRSCNDQTLRSLHARRHKRAARACLACLEACVGEEKGGESEVKLLHIALAKVLLMLEYRTKYILFNNKY